MDRIRIFQIQKAFYLMTREEIVEVLKEVLTVELSDSYESERRYLYVKILVDGEIVSYDSISIPDRPI